MEKSDSLSSLSASRPSASNLRAAHLIERLGRLLRSGDHARGLAPAQAEALRYLARANRFSRTPAALSDFHGATRGTVSQTLIALEAKGLVEKEKNPRDGRSVTLALTPAGYAMLEADPLADLARALERSGAGEGLADDLEAALRTLLAAREGRTFGACRTCRHFRADQRAGAAPHHCGLLDEPLWEADAAAICAEHAE